MQKYHQTSPHRAQSIRLFGLIHELNNSQFPTLNANSLDKFLKSCGLNYSHDLVKFMHGIDKQDKEMRQQYWGFCISKALQKVQVNSQLNYLELHKWIKMLLVGTYVEPLNNYELWDGENVKSQMQKDQRYARILNTFGQISLYILKIDFMVFTNSIHHINTCFSLINVFPGEKTEIIQKYETILKGSFLQTLQFALTMNVPENILIEMLKSLCYLYQSLKYQKIRKILEQSFLVLPETLQGLLQNIKDKRPEIRYYTCALMSLMVNNVQSVSTLVLSNKELLHTISNAIALISEREGLIYGIEFMIGIVKGFNSLSQQEKKQNLNVISVYMQFVIGKLGQLDSVNCQTACIRLVLEVVKVMDLNDDNLKLLKFIDNVFQSDNQANFQPLFQVTLQIAKFSIIHQRKNVQKYILNDKCFETYLKSILRPAHEEWEPFYSALQIILLMASSPENCDILFQRDLIQCIFGLSESRNGIVLFYLSQIVLSLILNSLESQWKITYLYEKDCLKVISTLIGNWMKPDLILQKQYGLQGVSHGNWQIFVNGLKALHFLNIQSGNLSLLKKQFYIKNFSLYFINNIAAGILSVFNVIPNRQYLSYLLKQQHSLGRNLNQHQTPFAKLYRMLSTTIEEMTFVLRKRNNTSLQVLKQVNNLRNQLHKCLYSILTYNQLVVENVPIYLVYAASVDEKMERQRVYRLGWNQYKLLLWEFVKKMTGVDADYFRIMDKMTKTEIRTEDDYRKLLDRVLNDYQSYNFVLDVEIINIREKQDQRDMIPAGSMRIGDPDMARRMDIPRFMSARMPQARDASPYASRKVGSRNMSPNFGTICRDCNRPTTNRSHICNACVQNREFR